MKTSTKKSLSEKLDVKIIITGDKLSSQFNIKDDRNKQHKHSLVYFSRCSSTDCADSYIGKAGRHLSERVMDYAGRETNSHIVRHYLNSNHETVNIENFKILNMEYNNNTYRRRISEALFLKQYHPSLNVPDNHVPLQLFH